MHFNYSKCDIKVFYFQYVLCSYFDFDNILQQIEMII